MQTITSLPRTALSICVYVWRCWRSCVLKASRRAGVGEQHPAHSRPRFLQGYNIGRPGRIKLSRACSLRCKVTAFLHCCVRSSWKRYFPRACSEALHGSAVTGVTFLLPGGDSLDSAARLVWGLWCLLKGALCLIAPEHCIMAVLPLFSLNADWLAPQFTGSAQLKSAMNPRFFLCGTFSAFVDNGVSIFFMWRLRHRHIFDCVLVQTVGWSPAQWWHRLYEL